jgi:hypothetical protein
VLSSFGYISTSAAGQRIGWPEETFLTRAYAYFVIR